MGGSTCTDAPDLGRISQDDLAELAEVSRVTLGSIERGEHAAGVLAFLKLSRALGIRMGALLDEEAP